MRTMLAGVFCAAATVAACGAGSQQTQPAAAANAGGAGAAANGGGAVAPDDQVATGQALYGQSCAKCHGASGEGSAKAPPVVGKGALPLDPRPGAKRTGQFKTVADVATFVKAAMPPLAPGSLTDDQYWAILAFDLKANGIDLGGKKLDGPLASTLVIPR